MGRQNPPQWELGGRCTCVIVALRNRSCLNRLAVEGSLYDIKPPILVQYANCILPHGLSA